jgi:hypothetical protein
MHWRTSNSELLSRAFAYEALKAAAMPLSQHFAGALVPRTIDSLVFACLHLARHGSISPIYAAGTPTLAPDRLIWLYDIHLLAASLDSPQWEEVIRIARAKGLSGVCLGALQAARSRLGTDVPPAVLQELRSAEPGAASSYLAAGAWRRRFMDLGAARSWRHRIRWLHMQLFPPRDYMVARYPDWSGSLALRYLRRVTHGLLGRDRRSHP